mgnify:CR=1 FL=1
MRLKFLIFLFFGCISLFAKLPDMQTDDSYPPSGRITYTRAINPEEIKSYQFDESYKPFYHGVASGDPTANSVIIWTRVTPDNDSDIIVEWKISSDPQMANIVKSGIFTTNNDMDYTAKIDVAGLEPGKTYYYNFSVNDRQSIIGRTRTLPSDGITLVKLAVLTCSNMQWGYFNAFKDLAEKNDVFAVIHTGDYFYEYDSSHYKHPGLPDRSHYPNKELLSLEDYRLRYSQYRLEPDLRRIHQQFPFITVWDDHEHANDCWRGGAENHQDETEGNWASRMDNSVSAYYEWMPIRKWDSNDKAINRIIRFGGLLDLVLLETRLTGRDKPLNSKGYASLIDTTEWQSPGRTMLGEVQTNWLLDNLAKSKATWKLTVSSVMMMQAKGLGFVNMDSWDGYPSERNRILRFLNNKNIRNFGVLSGDFHMSFAGNLAINPIDGFNPATAEGAVGFEFTTPSVSSANFNELEKIEIPPGSGNYIKPLESRMPDRHPITLQAEALVQKCNPHIKYVNLDQHGYYILSVTPGRIQADYYFSENILQNKNNMNFVKGIYLDRDSYQMHFTGTPAPLIAETAAPAPVPPPVSVTVNTKNLAGVYLNGIYKNPGKKTTVFSYIVTRSQKLKLAIFDESGSQIDLVLSEFQNPGLYEVEYEFSGQAKGPYYCVIEATGAKYSRLLTFNN